MGDMIGAMPVLVRPPLTNTVEANIVEGVEPVTPL
jgi:hypothetical protein